MTTNMKFPKVWSSKFSLVMIAAAALVIIGLANTMIKTARIDLTDNKLFTITQGSKNIIKNLQQPIELKLFFSNKLTQETAELRGLRNYAQRVQELLFEYELLSSGKITLTIIDPEPFSEAEDEAAALGIQAVPLAFGSDELYFGLVAIGDDNRQESISFFQPNREEFLEYEVSEIISKLGKTKVPVVGLMTSLQMQGGFDMTTRQPTPAWMIMQQIEGAFAIETLPTTTSSIADTIDILMLVHPKELSDATLYAIDQYILGGGNALIFVDPHAEQDLPVAGSDPSASNQSSSLEKLFQQWGLELMAEKVLGDGEHAMAVGVGNSQRPIRHLGLQTFGPDNFSAKNIITSQLETINVASAGILTPLAQEGVGFTPVIQSSTVAMPLDAERFKMLRDPRILAENFSPTNQIYTIAARVSGKFQSAFPLGAPASTPVNEEASNQKNQGHLEQAVADVHILVVADTDLLSDRLWVRVQDFFGQRVAQAWADNSDFVLNSLEQVSGSADLIGIRSRGQSSRPFTVVEGLQREAEARFQAKEDELTEQLATTEQKLVELQQQKEQGQGALELSPEQQSAIEQFQADKLAIRKQLRDVRHQLDKDIQSLGQTIKAINIVFVPLLITCFALVFVWSRNRREAQANS